MLQLRRLLLWLLWSKVSEWLHLCWLLRTMWWLLLLLMMGVSSSRSSIKARELVAVAQEYRSLLLHGYSLRSR